MSLPPQAWIIQNKLVFNEIDSRGFVIAFYKINPPDIHNASNQFSNGWEAQVVNFLNSLSEDYPFQIRWRVHSNFQSELLQFDADTDTFSPDPKDWTHQERKRTFKKLWRAMEERKLRREECVIAIKRKIRTNPKLGIDPQKNQEALEMVLNEIESDFRVKEGVLQSRLGGRGCTIKRLDDKEIALEFSYFLNPSYYDRFNYDPLDNFDSDETVQMNFFNSSVVGAGEEGWKGFFNRLGFRHKKDELPYGFYSDGYYHNIIALKRKPRSTEMGDFHALTSLGFLDYEIVVNIYPLSPQAEIDKAELLINRLDNDYQEEKKHSYLKGIKREQNKVDDLSEGYTRPFHVEYLIHVWAPEQNMLHNKTEAIKSALQSINQAQIAEINIPTTAINLWHNCWPGNLNDGYKYRQIYFQSENLSNLIPLSSSFVGILDKPESLYVGTNGNLVGLKGFVDGQPQHASMFGSSGGGKSVSICTELSMTRCFYDYIVVIEEGFAYYRLFKKYGFESFVISPNSRITLNYFDTQGLPLTNEHMDFVIAIVSKMAGEIVKGGRKVRRLAR